MLFQTVLSCYLATVASAIGFNGHISNVPDTIAELHHQKDVAVLNGDNYQSRILVDLYSHGRVANAARAVVDEKYFFSYRDLVPGEYELVVNSYDFILSNNRYRIVVDADSVTAYEDYLHEALYNKTSAVDLASQPLTIAFVEPKQYYEYALGSLSDMVLNSPLGFIFKNKVYTMLFTVSIGIMVAPYVLSWISPEFAEQFKDIQMEVAQEKQTTPPPDSTGADTGSATGARAAGRGNSAPKKRR